jgi:Pyruvate/2-oxoacid:ferredoxin oxidoreductase delta subunit
MDLCTGCGVCVENCPVVNEAIAVSPAESTDVIQ